jgi:hypothetical protein
MTYASTQDISAMLIGPLHVSTLFTNTLFNIHKYNDGYIYSTINIHSQTYYNLLNASYTIFSIQQLINILAKEHTRLKSIDQYHLACINKNKRKELSEEIDKIITQNKII